MRVVFRWASEPGVTFAYDHRLNVPPVTSSIATDAAVVITEEIATGLVSRARREPGDDHVRLVPPVRPARAAKEDAERWPP